MREPGLAGISTLLASRDCVFHNVGIQQVLENLPYSIAPAIEYLAQAEADMAYRLIDSINKFCPYLQRPYSTQQDISGRTFPIFDDLRSEMELFLAAVQNKISYCSAHERHVLTKRLARFLGVRQEVREIVRAAVGDDAADEFDAAVASEESKAMDRQLMLFLSYRCNLDCPYCFAKGNQGDMPLDMAVELIDWAKENGATVITFLGGEPTIYPHFIDVLHELKCRGLYTFFATNLLAEPDVIHALEKDFVRSLVVHVAHKNVYKPGQWDMLNRNLADVLSKGLAVSLRANAYAHGHDWSHLFELTDKFGVKEVQYALTFPGGDGSNAFVKRDDLAAMIPEVMEMQRLCDEKGLHLIITKPLPPCLFPLHMQTRIARLHEYQISCTAPCDGYSHNLCVLPDGGFVPCMAMLDVKYPATEPHDYDRIADFCKSQLQPWLDKPLFEDCVGCFLFARKICQGSCIGHKRELGL
ncbi:radical SAM protein [bacterium]|nr:radical SAM protein [bacterium]